MLKAVLFDLDGTLLPMDQATFMKDYFGRLMGRLAPLGYTPEVFLAAMKAGITAMTVNDGSRANEEAYWEAYSASSGRTLNEELPVLDTFYNVEFDEVAAVCGRNPKAAELVRSLKAKGIRVILATNPLYPAVATESRMRWAGLNKEDFVLYTTYENSRHCKPNPSYYLDVLEECGLRAEECLMVGNDRHTDIAGAKASGLATVYMHTALTPYDQAPADPALLPGVAPKNCRHFEYEGDNWSDLVTLVESIALK